jgi:hypothetical protein
MESLMTLIFIELVFAGAVLYFWLWSKPEVLWEPKQQYLATLLLVATSASNAQNTDLYQATLKEIIRLMSREYWERQEINWRLSQALQIAKQETSTENFEKVRFVSQNITRWTVHSPTLLPWEVRPLIKLLAQTSPALAPPHISASA